MNSINLIGNLTRDPELRSLPSGTSVCKMRLAVNTRRKVDGEWVDKANYFDVSAFGGRGESSAEYLSKGSRVGVSGRLESREWEAEDGTKRNAVEIVADQVDFLNTKKSDNGEPEAPVAAGVGAAESEEQGEDF
jgi:single-strand DNA-binding protein